MIQMSQYFKVEKVYNKFNGRKIYVYIEISTCLHMYTVKKRHKIVDILANGT